MAISVIQSKTGVLSAEDTSAVITFDSNVSAGSTLVLVGVSVDSASSLSTLLSSVSDTQTNEWIGVTNARASNVYAPNAFAAYTINASAGSTTITAALNDGTANAISWAAFEIGGVPTSGSIDVVVTGTASGTTETSTTATGTLDQAANIAILAGGGWCGTPNTVSGWTNVLSQPNTGTQIGAQIAYRTLASTASIVGTVTHEAASQTSAVMVIVKEATGGSLRYKFTFDSSTFTSADTGITGFVWRNKTPEIGAAEKYTDLAGDASAGILYITDIPSGVEIGDTLYGIFYNATDTSGIITGVVESS